MADENDPHNLFIPGRRGKRHMFSSVTACRLASISVPHFKTEVRILVRPQQRNLQLAGVRHRQLEDAARIDAMALMVLSCDQSLHRLADDKLQRGGGSGCCGPHSGTDVASKIAQLTSAPFTDLSLKNERESAAIGCALSKTVSAKCS